MLRERVEANKIEIYKQMVVQLADIIYESRTANKVVFELELYSTFMYFVLRALRTPILHDVNWHELPSGHTLLPYWQLAKRRNRSVLTLYYKVDKPLVIRFIDRLCTASITDELNSSLKIYRGACGFSGKIGTSRPDGSQLLH